jgi:hypothetical protein
MDNYCNPHWLCFSLVLYFHYVLIFLQSHIVLCIYDFKHHVIVYQGLILQNWTTIVAKNSSKKMKTKFYIKIVKSWVQKSRRWKRKRK